MIFLEAEREGFETPDSYALIINAYSVILIVLLSRDFLKLIGLAILIAVPISWWGSRKWLENFAYKTSLSWWIFAAGIKMPREREAADN